MNWLFDHTEVITVIALVLLPILMIGGMMVIAGGKAPEVSDLQGAPETLGDFPPLPALGELKFPETPTLEELEEILKGE